MLRPIKFIPEDTQIDFLSRRKILAVVSIVFLLSCVASLGVRGLNFGIDFSGGLMVEVRMPEPVSMSDYRAKLNNLGLGDVSLTNFGEDARNLLIRVPEQEGGEGANQAALRAVRSVLGEESSGVEYRRTELVGPKVGDELVEAGAMAMGLSILIIAAYIWFRFEWQYAVGGIIALVHDIVAVIGFYSLFGVQFDLTSVAAVLTVAGYSINDTVVIFDRVREELRRYKKLELRDVLNLAINKTLSRTILTSLTTLLAVGFLAAFGGDVLRGFSLALLFGIVLGTYSTIYVAVPSLILFQFRRSGEDDEAEEGDGDGDDEIGGAAGKGRAKARKAKAPALPHEGEDPESLSGEQLAARAAAAEKAAAEPAPDEGAAQKRPTPGKVTGKARKPKPKRQ